MRKLLLLFILFIAVQGYSQKDSIINFLGRKGKVIKNKEKVRFFEIITKKSDSLWLTKRYRRNGKQVASWFTKDKERKNKIGESKTFNGSGKLSSIVYYNLKGNKTGRYRSWFDNTAKNIEGIYIDGSKEGVWKYYHYNGVLASRKIYKKDSLLKSSYYNEKGVKIKHDKSLCLAEASFKGGSNAFYQKVKKLYPKLGYKVKGVIYVDFTIDIYGNIRNVIVNENVTPDLKNKIITFFEKIKGWSPAIQVHRKIPFNISIPLKFRG
mgnify:FL=1